MFTLLAFIVTIGILVTVHEYGHYQVAKWCGVKVLKFSIGFGNTLWSKIVDKDGMELIVAAIPLGGYVKFLDERELNEQETAPAVHYSEADLDRAFNRQSVFKRIAIVLAGPFANFLLAILLYWLLLMVGVMGIKPSLGKVIVNSPAAMAGFKPNETITKISGNTVDTWQEASFAFLKESLKNQNVDVEVVSDYQKPRTRKLNLASIDFDNEHQDVLTVLGFTLPQTDIPARISEVKKGGPADVGGLQANDLVLSIGQQRIVFWQDFTQVVKQNAGKSLDVLIKRNAKEITLKVTPDASTVDGKILGMIGVAAQDNRLTKIDYSAWRALTKSVTTTWDTSILSLKLMGKLVTGQLSLKNMSGPVTIANAAGDSADRGWKQFVGFLAFISISIGVMNLLPIPVLDGGHLMYYMAELLTGKPVSESIMVIGQKIGIFLLGLMMIIAFYNDINRLITG